MINPLDITGQCILTIDDGEEIRLKAQHDTIVVDLLNVRAGLTLLTYPGFAKTARDEGFDEIAEWFETLARAERSHAGRFAKGLENLKS